MFACIGPMVLFLRQAGRITRQQQCHHLQHHYSTTPSQSRCLAYFHHHHHSSSSSTIRLFHCSSLLQLSLDEFRDSVSRQKRASEPVGRAWSAKELRRKSFDDLHKLWLVLYKERNMLLTEQQLSRRKNILFPQPDRLRKTRKSMGAIRHVLGERKREHLARIAHAQLESSAAEKTYADVDDDGNDDEKAKDETKVVSEKEEGEEPQKPATEPVTKETKV